MGAGALQAAGVGDVGAHRGDLHVQGAGGDGVEDGVCGVGDDLDVDIRVKAVAGTAEGSAIMLRRVRGLLSPDRSWTAVAVDGRAAHIRFVRSEFVGVDRSVKAADTDRHPGVAVDTYRLVSQPAP